MRRVGDARGDRDGSGDRVVVHDLERAAGAHPYETRPSLEEAIARGMALADADPPLLIAGSVYAAGEARRILTQQYRAPTPSY